MFSSIGANLPESEVNSLLCSRGWVFLIPLQPTKMEENCNLGCSDDIQEVALPFTIEEETISDDEQSNSPTTRHGMSSK